MSVKQIVVFITAANRPEAEKISRHLVEGKYVACTNIVPRVSSLYWWKGKIESADEVFLMAKTTLKKFKAMAAAVRKLHSYEVPEIIALPIVAGSDDYLHWIDESVR
jgi:periplasmic divalent cation tolerance protein